MTKFSLMLSEDSDRPIVALQNLGISALLDTGARLPVWVGSINLLRVLLQARLFKSAVQFEGFGGSCFGDLYIIPELTIGSLHYTQLPVVACDLPGNPKFRLILSSTMFSGLIYEIDEVNHKLNVTIPSNTSDVRKLTVSENGNRLAVACTGTSQSVSRINAFG